MGDRKSSSYFGSFFGTKHSVEYESDRINADSDRSPPRAANRDSTNSTSAVVEPNNRLSQRTTHSDVDDEQTATDNHTQATGDPSGKKSNRIKFKKASALARKASTAYFGAANATAHSRFHGWSKAHLAELLISHGIELRNESTIEQCTLKDLCEALYADHDMPEKPTLPGLFEVVFMNIHARRIQNVWVCYCMEKRMAQEQESNVEYRHRMSQLASVHDMDADHITEAELMYMENPHMEIVADGRLLNRASSVRLLSRDDGDDAGDAEDAEEVDGEAEAAEDEGKDEEDDEAAAAADEGKTDEEKAESARIRAEQRSKKKTERHKQHRKKKHAVNILDLPWDQPLIEKAEVYSNYVQPRKGGKGGTRYDCMATTTGRHCCLGSLGEQFDLWEEGQISEFGIYGSGITNYFKFIKWCFWLFMTLAVLSLPMLIMNIQGPNVTNDGLQALARTTAGNLADTFEDADFSLAIPGCTGYGVYNFDCSLNRRQLSRFYAYLDVFIVLTAFAGFLWLRKYERIEEATLDKNTVNASMFTVAVSNLPADVTEEEITEHFGKVCKGHKIAAVSLAFNNFDEIEQCTQRGNLIRKKVRAVHEHRHRCTMWKQSLAEDDAAARIKEEREAFFVKQAAFTEQLKEKETLLEEIAETPSEVVYAFVTFDKVAGREEALEHYNSHSVFYYMCYANHLKLKGKLLKVHEANEPSTILWENLSFTHWQRTKRRLATSLLALLLIVISLFTIFSADYLEETRSPVGDDDENLCPENFEDKSDDYQIEYVEENEDLIYCYCDQLSTLRQAVDSTCRSYFYDRMEAQIFAFFASLIVLIVNFLLEQTVKFCSVMERHHTEDGRGTSMFSRVFILKYINTSLVFFINNNPTIMRSIFGVDSNTKAEFTADWFNTVGVTIILVQLGDVFTSHADKVLKTLKHYHRLGRAKNPKLSTALTQDELNQAYVGPEFEFAFNYAQLLATIFVCFTFSAGIPVLYMIGAGNFFVTYFVEKYFFIHLYRIPPHFSNKVGKRATAWIPYALVLHCAIAIWMFTNDNLFNNSGGSGDSGVGGDVVSSDISEKVSGATALPLFIIMLIILLLRVLTHFFKEATAKVTACVKVVFGRCYKREDPSKTIASAQAIVTYTRAVQRNLIKGLATYNILQNPIYKEQFAITWKFAVANKNVRDVRNLKAKAYAGNTETDAEKVDRLQRNANAHGTRAKPAKLAKNRSFASSFYMPVNGSVDEGDNDNKGQGKHAAVRTDEAPRDSASPSNRMPFVAPINIQPSGPDSVVGSVVSSDVSPRSGAADITDILAPAGRSPRHGSPRHGSPRHGRHPPPPAGMYDGPPVVAQPASPRDSRDPNRTPRRVHVHRDGTVSVSRKDPSQPITENRRSGGNRHRRSQPPSSDPHSRSPRQHHHHHDARPVSGGSYDPAVAPAGYYPPPPSHGPYGPPYSPYAHPHGHVPPPGPMHGGAGAPGAARPFVPRIDPDGFENADHLLYEH